MFERWKLQDFAPGEGRELAVYQPGYDDSAWIDAPVPGDVHLALMAAGRIADPFYDQNENEARWMEEREWWYRTTFQAPGGLGAKDERLLLTFKGIDTFAVLYLNGSLLGRHQNMFREAVFDVTHKLKPGVNTLAVRFDPPLSKLDPNTPFKPWGENPERVFMRKAQFGFGWDWGPRLPTIGLWQPVDLKRHRVAALLGVQFGTIRIDMKKPQFGQAEGTPSAERAVVMVKVEASRFSGSDPLKAEIRLKIPGEKKPVVDETLTLDAPGSLQEKTAYFTLDHPTLWWTHDLGEPFLYDLRVTLRKGKEVLDTHEAKVGVRTIALDQSPDPDEPGTRFFRFMINGVPIFARGADWIPAYSFVGAIPEEKYRRPLLMARDANMNMLRVWGGGIYEHETFFDWCDQLGILVWQDFMFASASYPETDPYAAEVDAEVRYQVRRLRSRASLALWCGNNENQWIHDLNNPHQLPPDRVPGARYYDHIIPRAVAELDGLTHYWPSSPYGGNDHNSAQEGDRHNWHVWHGMKPRLFGETSVVDHSPEGVSYRHYADDMARFISEFGMHAAPVFETLRRVIPADQRYHHSPSMDHHNKDNPKNKGDNLMLTVTGLPKDLPEYIDFSMIAQAEGLKFGIEHYRRRMPHCSGTLVWQLNDCWPVLSWSLIDYYGFGKAGYFYTQRVYAPVLVSFKELDGGGAELWVTNDTLADFTDTLKVKLAEFSGIVVWEKEINVTIPAHTSLRVAEWTGGEIQPSPARYLSVRSTEGKFPPNRLFFAPIKDLERQPVQPEMKVSQVDEKILAVEITAPGYAYFVHLEHPSEKVRYSDNYFELEPGETRLVWVGNEEEAIDPSLLTLGYR